jgi:hypothetical protein
MVPEHAAAAKVVRMIEHEADDILDVVAEHARQAFQAELNFLEWMASNGSEPLDQFMERYLEWFERSESFAKDYLKISNNHPQLLRKFAAIVEPIRREMFGAEQQS